LSFGLGSVWKLIREARRLGDVGPAEFYRLMRGCAERLDQVADYRVTRLTDLVPLLERLSKCLAIPSRPEM
jgi:hypothetical protein